MAGINMASYSGPIGYSYDVLSQNVNQASIVANNLRRNLGLATHEEPAPIQSVKDKEVKPIPKEVKEKSKRWSLSGRPELVL
jgi:hypothetical protein